METTSYKDFLYSVEAEVAEKKKQVEKQNVSASKPVEKNSHMVAAKKAEKPSVFDKLKELPGKVDNLNKDLLIAQLRAMETYLTILSIRIGLNRPTQEEKQLDEAIELAKSTINE